MTGNKGLREKYFDCLDRLYLNKENQKRGNSRLIQEQIKRDEKLKETLWAKVNNPPLRA